MLIGRHKSGITLTTFEHGCKTNSDLENFDNSTMPMSISTMSVINA